MRRLSLHAAILLTLLCSNAAIGLVVSNINPSSYIVVNNGLNVGSVEFIDRAYTFSAVPSAYQGETYIQTANNDRGSTGDSFLTFDIDQDSTVYVAHDDRLSNPSWMADFTDTGDHLTSSDGGYTFSLYGKDFTAGTVALGGNYGDSTVSMYSVVVVPIPVTTPPDPATNPSPVNTGVDISVETDLSWTAGVGAASHDVYFGTTSPGDFQINQPGTTFDPGTLANDMTYYWRIDEVNAAGTTVGTVWNFTTEASGSAPDPASNLSPANTVTDVSLNADLSWTAGAGATSHDVYFGTTSPGDFQINQSGTTFDPGAMALNTTYYWRIDEVNAYGTTTGTVWSFTTVPVVYDQVGYWPMDDNAANATVVDVAGGYNGTFYSNGSPENTSLHHSSDFVEGTGSLDFDGNDYIALPRNSVLETGNTSTKKFSASAWIKDESGGTGSWGTIMGTGDGGWVLARNGNNNNGITTGFWLTSPGDLVIIDSSTSISDGLWHHVAVVYNVSSITLYVDGVAMSGSASGGTINNMSNKGVLIGENAGAIGRYWNGLIDDVQIYDYALTAEDIHLMYNPEYAWEPFPVDGKIGASLDSILSWSPGEDAISHDVYFGTDETAVANAQRLAGDFDGDGTVGINDLQQLASQWLTGTNLEEFITLAADWGLTASAEFIGNQSGTTYTPGTLAYDTTYYWRIDEVSAAGTVTGEVWSFTTLVPVPIGSLIVDADYPAWLKYSEGNHLFMCGPGDPEDFLYRGTRNADGTRDGDQMTLINKLAPTGANCIYFQAVKSHGGDGDSYSNPFVDGNVNGLLDEDILYQWETWFTAMDDNGIVIFMQFYDDAAQPFGYDLVGGELPSQEAYMIDEIVNRFEHHKNLIWCVAEEYTEAISSARASKIAERIKLADDYDHPVGIHQTPSTSFDFNGDANMDQFAMQLNDSETSFIHSSCVAAWNNVGGQKNVNLAELYEWNNIAQTGAALRQKAWSAAMAGAYSMWLWMDIASTPVSDLEICGRVVTFMESTKFYMTQPSDSLKRGTTDYVLADPGNVYIVYSDSAGTQLGVNVQAGNYQVKWYDPIDGDWSDQGSQAVASGDQYFIRPSIISSTEAVLYLEKTWSTYGIEAEDYDTQTGVMSWVLDTEVPGYDGTGYMKDTRNLHTDPSSTLNYLIDFPKAGTYYCYLRYWSLPSSDPDASYSNGFHLEFDGTRQSTLTDAHGTRIACYSTKEGAWKWATQWQYGESDVAGPLSIYVNSAGTHTLGITARDQLFKYDRIVITDYKVGGQDYSTSSAPAFLDVLETVPNGYN